MKTEKRVWDMDEIRKEMAEQEWEEVDKWTKERRVFLGTVFALYPSGKYYTPFANSNVEICESCADAGALPCDETSPCTPPEDWDGEGEYHCEACRDAAWQEQAETELEEAGYYMTGGDGDPCDVFAVETKDIEEETEE